MIRYDNVACLFPGCRVTPSTTLDLTYPTPRQPHHAADETDITVSKLRNTTRDQAANSLDRPGQIFAQAVAVSTPEGRARLPNPDNNKRSLRH